jgi:hypothetical protein
MTQQYPPPNAQPDPAQHHYRQPPRNGFGITALALALVGLVFCLMPITGGLGLILGMLALLFGLLGLGRVRKGAATNKGVTIAGLVLAVCAVIGGFFAMKTFFDILSGFGKSDSPPVAVGAPAVPGPAGDDAAPEQPTGGTFDAGQAVDRDGMQITAGPLKRVKREYGDPLLCSRITYRNTGDQEESFNAFDWKIQSPDGVQESAYSAEKNALSSGQLAPGGTVAGDVCRKDSGGKGEYLVINDQTFADAIRWKTSI